MLTIAFALVIVVSVCIYTNTVEVQYVENGMIAYWTFDEAGIDGNTVRDVMGNYDGAINGNPQIVERDIAGALQFNQDSLVNRGDYVDFGVDISTEMAGNVTVEGWFRMSLGAKMPERKVYILMGLRRRALGRWRRHDSHIL